MRKMLAQCSSEELFNALQNQQQPKYTHDGQSFDVTNTESDHNFEDKLLQNNSTVVANTKNLFHQRYNEFWNTQNVFNNALLRQMITIELSSNNKHSTFYQQHAKEIFSYAEKDLNTFLEDQPIYN